MSQEIEYMQDIEYMQEMVYYYGGRIRDLMNEIDQDRSLDNHDSHIRVIACIQNANEVIEDFFNTDSGGEII